MTYALKVLFNPGASAWQQDGEALRDWACSVGGECQELDPENRWLETIRRHGDNRRLCVCGGDGTVSRVVEALCRAELNRAIELAVVPLGTGNDFARSIGVNAGSFEQAIHVATHGESRWVDAVRVTDAQGKERIIINAATAGFGGIVTDEVEDADKQRWGALAYWIAAFSRLTSLPEYRVTIEQSGQRQTIDVFGVAVTSGRYVGGGFPVSPEAWINDGLLDVTVVPAMPLGDAFAAGMEFTFGYDSGSERVQTYQVTSVRVEADPPMPYSLDGESEENLATTFEVIPRAVRVVVNSSAPAIQSGDASADPIAANTTANLKRL